MGRSPLNSAHSPPLDGAAFKIFGFFVVDLAGRAPAAQRAHFLRWESPVPPEASPVDAILQPTWKKRKLGECCLPA